MTVDPEIIGRIRKLFALARDKGATEAEAASALEKANDLLLRHNLSADAVSAEKPSESVSEQGIRLGRRDSWRHRLVITLAKHNLCDCFYSGDRVVMVGRPTNIATTREMFDWIAPQLVTIADDEYRRYLVEIDDEEAQHRGGMWCPECEAWRHDDDIDVGGKCWHCDTRMLATPRVHGKTWKVNFMRGILQRIKNRLYEQRQAQKVVAAEPAHTAPSGAEVTALVLRTGKEIEEYNRRHHPDLITRRSRGSGFHAGAYGAGARRGADITLGGQRLGGAERPRLGQS